MDIGNAVAIAVPFTAGRETFSANPYWDVNGYAIGYGNHYYADGSAVTADDNPIDEPTARWLLGFYLTQAATTIAPMLQVQVSDSMLAALTDLGYNWGTGSVGNSILLQKINQGAAQEDIVTQWQKTAVTSGGQPNADLVDRRAKEAALAYSGTDTLGITALALAGLFIFAFIYFTAGKKSISF